MAQSELQEDDAYKMTSVPLGFFVIVNIINFEENKHDERINSIENVYLLKETFERLKFKVKSFQDLNNNEIKPKLNELLNSEDCDKHDCFVLYIHSHGNKNGFITADNCEFKFNEILELFKDYNCKKFIDKPKLIFFDCCRGQRNSVDSTEEDYTRPNDTSFKDQSDDVHKDVFVCFSTLKNSVSKRNLFAQTLRDCLLKFANEKQFSDIITEMNKLIQKKCYPIFDQCPTKYQQLIEYRSFGKRKKLYFNYSNQTKDPSENEEINLLVRDTNIWSEKLDLFNEKSPNHVEMLKIEENNIESIEENDFNEIRIDKIEIRDCPIKRIHWSAFGKHSENVKELIARDKITNLKSYPKTDYDLFKLINSLLNCELIYIKSFHAELQSINLSNLRKLWFDGLDSSIKITSICDFAFKYCDKLEWLNLSENYITYISTNAFCFKNHNDSPLELQLKRNYLQNASFAINSLNKMNRPVKLDLEGNDNQRIEYLDEDVFKSFFDANKLNQIFVDKNYFHERHDRNAWNQSADYKNRINIKIN